jgi:hypothetical protein
MNPGFVDLLRAFRDADVRFLVVGAYALAVHGRPRATGDLDVWVDASPANAARVMRGLSMFGAPMEAIALMSALQRLLLPRLSSPTPSHMESRIAGLGRRGRCPVERTRVQDAPALPAREPTEAPEFGRIRIVSEGY